MTTRKRIEEVEVEVDSTDRQGLVFMSTSGKCEVTHATLEAYSTVMKVQFDLKAEVTEFISSTVFGALSLAIFFFHPQ